MKKISFGEKIRIPDYADLDQIRHATIRFDYSKCNSCYLCQAACPASAISKKDDRPYFRAGLSECMFCGNCQAICPREAVTLAIPYQYSGCFKTIDHLTPKPPRK